MHIIIEGPDCSGKTRLAFSLATQHRMAYHHEGPPPENMSSVEHYTRVLEQLKSPTIIDRFALGERVYGPILRGHDSLGQEGWEHIQHLIIQKHIFQIICLTPRRVLLKNYLARRRTESLSIIQFLKSIKRWEAVARNTYVFDYTDSSSLPLLNVALKNWYPYAS